MLVDLFEGNSSLKGAAFVKVDSTPTISDALLKKENRKADASSRLDDSYSGELQYFRKVSQHVFPPHVSKHAGSTQVTPSQVTVHVSGHVSKQVNPLLHVGRHVISSAVLIRKKRT